MNAQKTAEKLVELYQQYIKANGPWEDTIAEAATMLRQQQAEIENLKFYIDGLLAENKKLRNQWGYNGMPIPCSGGGGGAGQIGAGIGGAGCNPQMGKIGARND